MQRVHRRRSDVARGRAGPDGDRAVEVGSGFKVQGSGSRGQVRGPSASLHLHPRARRARHRARRGRRLAVRARVGAGHRTDHPHLHRHAARRSPAGVRLPQRQDAGHRRAGRRRRRLRARLQPRLQTLPAHVALLTGRLPFETGVRDDGGAGQGRRTAAGADAARPRLRDRRHRVVVDAARRDRHRPGLRFLRRPFDRLRVAVRSCDDGTTAGRGRGADGRRTPPRRGGVGSRRRATGSPRWAPRALFLFLHLHEPHAPYAPPERFGALAPYDGAIAYADEIVGRLVQVSEGHQLYDQSTIVLVSDHGEGLGDHGEQEHGLFLYDEAIHVPLIIKQAGGRGRRTPRRRSRPARRHRADDPRPGQGAGARATCAADRSSRCPTAPASGRRIRRCTRKHSTAATASAGASSRRSPTARCSTSARRARSSTI